MDFLGRSRTLKLIVDTLSESRLIPKTLLRRRSKERKQFLSSFVSHGGVGAEIGVQKGFFSHVILDAVRPSRLHLIDPWYLLGERWEWADANKSTTKALRNIIYWFQRELAQGDIVLHIGFDIPVLAALPDHYFDWVYLDTSHTYDDTKQELTVLKDKVKTNGVIVGDDWFSNAGHPFYGQYCAINEFVSATDYIILSASDADHQWALKKQA